MTLGRPRLHLRETGSTNDRARELAAAGAPHGTLVTAAAQSAGRGRQGRAWSAPPGHALLMSLVLRDAHPLLPLAAAVAVAERRRGRCADQVAQRRAHRGPQGRGDPGRGAPAGGLGGARHRRERGGPGRGPSARAARDRRHAGTGPQRRRAIPRDPARRARARARAAGRRSCSMPGAHATRSSAARSAGQRAAAWPRASMARAGSWSSSRTAAVPRWTPARSTSDSGDSPLSPARRPRTQGTVPSVRLGGFGGPAASGGGCPGLGLLARGAALGLLGRLGRRGNRLGGGQDR